MGQLACSDLYIVEIPGQRACSYYGDRFKSFMEMKASLNALEFWIFSLWASGLSTDTLCGRPRGHLSWRSGAHSGDSPREEETRALCHLQILLRGSSRHMSGGSSFLEVQGLGLQSQSPAHTPLVPQTHVQYLQFAVTEGGSPAIRSHPGPPSM